MMQKIVPGQDPAAIITGVIRLLKSEGKPVTKKNIQPLTPFTVLQIASEIRRDYNLQQLFEEHKPH
jgi:hypothetical protein